MKRWQNFYTLSKSSLNYTYALSLFESSFDGNKCLFSEQLLQAARGGYLVWSTIHENDRSVFHSIYYNRLSSSKTYDVQPQGPLFHYLWYRVRGDIEHGKRKHTFFPCFNFHFPLGTPKFGKLCQHTSRAPKGLSTILTIIDNIFWVGFSFDLDLRSRL